jgi:LPS-assembly lipoprotein
MSRLVRVIRPAMLLAALAVAGCGFHLAGTRPVPEPLRSVYIEVIDPYHVTVPPLETALRARIERGGGEIASKIERSKSTLRISDLSETQEVLSVGPDGKAIEYRLVSRATYELTSGGHQLIPPRSQGLSRDYSFSATQILPKEAEAERLSQYLQTELADVILLRIESELARGSSPESLPPASPAVGADAAKPAPAAAPADSGDAAPAP